MKKTVKRLSVVMAAVLSFMCSTVSLGNYYVSNDYKQININDIVYEKFDRQRFDELTYEITELLNQTGMTQELHTLLDEYCNEFVLSIESESVAQLEMDKDYSEQKVKNKSDAYYLTIDMSKTFLNILWEIYCKTEYKTVLYDILGVEKTEELISTIPSSEYYELSKKEELLVNEYMKAQGDSERSAEIFLELVDVRNKIAVLQGYDNYADYADDMVYGRTYTDEETAIFSEEVAKNIKPLIPLMLDSVMYIPHGRFQLDDESILASVGNTVSDINDELKKSYDYMIGNKLYDISYSDKKNLSSGAYTLNLPKSDVPYLFISSREDNSSFILHTLIHEFGHFSAMLNEPMKSDNWNDITNNVSADTSEIHSQGLEMLTLDNYGVIFGKNAAYERYNEMLNMFTSILDGCMFDEWQTITYKSKNLTIEELNKNAAELIKKYYGYDKSKKDAQTVWTSIQHNFMSPMYYISYGVSGMVALDLFNMSNSDNRTAVDKYMKISSMGCYKDLKYVINNAGLKDIFQNKNVCETVEETAAELGLLYNDVDYNSWYIPYLYMTSAIYEGVTKNSFCPQNSITRNDFIELLGSMHDYYTGENKNRDSDEYIDWAYENGIVSGYEDGEIRGENPITREELVTILFRFNDRYGIQDNAETTMFENCTEYKDCNEISPWAKKSVEWAVYDGLLDGKENNLIEPQSYAKRSEAAKIVAMYIKNTY